nr:lantibiotic dehydratase [Planosporangium thailandense]
MRQAGFPLDLLDTLVTPDAAQEAAQVREAADRTRARARVLLDKLRGTPAASARPRLGMLGTLPADVPGADAYRQELAALTATWQRFERAHQARLATAGSAVTAMFRETPALREVLLLSNDAHFPRFAAWLDRPDEPGGRSGRRMTDMLTRYLQRVAAKNETTAHFGPITAGRLESGPPGVRWTDVGRGDRRVFCAHWAAEALADALSRRPGLRDAVRPRRRPLAFLDGDRVRVYSPATTTGFLADWRFEKIADEPVAATAAWLLSRCDGVRTVGELRRAWPGGDPAGLEETMAELAARDWLVARFEIPVGVADPLAALRAALPDPTASAAAAEGHRLVSELADLLAAFAAAAPTERPAALAAAKAAFTAATGSAANRNEGRHYADRAIYYEEGHSRVRDLTLGADLARLLSEELAPVYDLVLAGPRLRIRREREILARWMTGRFGTGRPVPLAEFFAGYLDDRAALSAECDPVDAELARLDDDVTDALLAGADPDTSEVTVPAERLAVLMASYPADPAAVCNPDLLLAAGSAADIAAGRYTAVLGECHAVRELLCHSSYAPLLAEQAPELASLVHEGYRGLLAPDEILVDLVRSHPNKTGAQLRFPIPDVEITGRSAKERGRRIPIERLYLIVHGGRVELRAHGIEQRLRPLSVPAGGPSIRQDPLSPLGFPRHFGGVTLRSPHRNHVPRIRYGRVVLRRESWRLPVDALRGTPPIPGTGATDAADFYAVQALRARLGLPRHLFVKVPGEPKPFFVDLEAPLLVRQLCRTARTRTGVVEVSEMLPGPDQLWLTVDGRGHTSELRYAVFSGPASGPAGVPGR